MLKENLEEVEKKHTGGMQKKRSGPPGRHPW